MKIADLFVGIGVKVEGLGSLDQLLAGLGTTQRQGNKAAQAVGGVSSEMARMPANALKAIAVIEAMNWALYRLAENAAKAGTALRQFSLQTGLSTQVLQQWQHLAEVNGVSADEMTESFKKFQLAREQFRIGEPTAVRAWSVLGVNPMQDPQKVLDDLRISLGKFQDVGQARLWAGKIGISDAMFSALVATNHEYDKLNENLTLSEKQIDNLRQQDAAWNHLRFELKAISTSAGSVLAPMFKVLADTLAMVLMPLAAFLKELADANWWTPLGQLRWALQLLVSLFILLGVVLAGVAAAYGVFVVWTGWATLGTSAFGLALGRLILVISQLVLASLPLLARGIAGVVTTLTTSLPVVTTAVRALTVALAPLLAGIGFILADLAGLLAIVTLVAGAFYGLYWLWKDFMKEFNGEESLFDWSAEIAMVNKLAEALEWLSEVWDKVFKGTTNGDDYVNRHLHNLEHPDHPMEEHPGQERAPLADWGDKLMEFFRPSRIDNPQDGVPGNVNNRTSSVHQENNVQVMVDGSGSPQETARAVGDSFKAQLTQAYRQMPVPSV